MWAKWAACYPYAMAKFNIKDQTCVDGVPLAERYERFCVSVTMTRTPSGAYRTAFVVDNKKLGKWVEEQATSLLAQPEIQARIAELRELAAQAQLTGVLDIMQDLHDIIAADPNEIVSFVRENCRRCYGHEHDYQWKNADEYLKACEQVRIDNKYKPTEDRLPEPSCDGGFGFDATRDPVEWCPACYGQGEGRVHIHDTRKLSSQAKKLYAGVKETANGIEIKMHDKDKARETLGRMLGAFKDGIPLPGTMPDKSVNNAPPTTAEDASKSYLKMISGGASNVVPIKGRSRGN